MTPIEHYKADIQRQHYHEDKLQLKAVQHTQRLFDEVINHPQQGVISRLLGKRKKIKGLYLWGGTGRGKTYLMDSFYECLKTDMKHRVHFHRFMLDIHERLEHLPRSPDPLEIVARQISENIKVLCLDEFHVHDIADAMLLAGLLKPLFDKGVILVATSNIKISNLYKNGLQRERFLHAISLLQEYTEEVSLGHGEDYRFNLLEETENYLLISSEGGKTEEDMMIQSFNELAPCKPKHDREININNRNIKYIALADDIIWFDYKELCQTPRSARDYIEIAERFTTVFVSQVQVMHEKDDSAAKRFVHFIDAIYDHNVKLVLSAWAEPVKLYNGKKLTFAFDRTVSRLTEMGTEKYLHLEHNPAGSVRQSLLAGN